MTTAKASKEQTVTWRSFAGNTQQVLEQVQACEFPKEWGPLALVQQFISQWIPSGNNWHGEIRVTGYRTPLNDIGTGTAYLSVHWEPKKGAA